jgi:hypothetical protein
MQKVCSLIKILHLKEKAMMMSKKIEDFFRSDIDTLNEYKILDSKKMIKLDAMENPFDLNVKF